jgi:hypothetical protein
MAYTGFQQTNPLDLPRTIDPAASLVEINPLPPPGRPIDGTADLHPARDALYPAVQHENTITLGGTITEANVWTMTITPVSTGHGVALADAMVPVVLTVTVNATATATSLGDQFVAAALAASTITTVAGVGASTRLSEILTMTNDTGVLTTVGVNPGATYTIAVVPEAGGTAPVVVTVNAVLANLRMGVWVARTGAIAADGRTPVIRPVQPGDTYDDMWGVVADGNRGEAIDSELGYTFRAYRAGRTVPILPKEGHYTVTSEGAVDAFDDVWIRTTATGAEIFGAVDDEPDFVGQVVTATPTVVNATTYAGSVNVYDGAGALVASTLYIYLSDGSATATEICDGIRVDLDAGAVVTGGSIVTSGTDTLIMSSQLPDHTIIISSTDAGVMTPAITTPATNDHVKATGPKFSRTTTAAGSASIDFTL